MGKIFMSQDKHGGMMTRSSNLRPLPARMQQAYKFIVRYFSLRNILPKMDVFSVPKYHLRQWRTKLEKSM